MIGDIHPTVLEEGADIIETKHLRSNQHRARANFLSTIRARRVDEKDPAFLPKGIEDSFLGDLAGDQ